MPEQVQCVDCGHLANNPKGPNEWVEVQLTVRGKWRHFEPTGSNAFIAFPDCFAKASDIRDECGNSSEGISNAVLEERVCDKFIRYVPGFDPKEHRRMFNEQQRELAAQEWRANQEAVARDWREGQNENARIFEREQTQRQQDFEASQQKRDAQRRLVHAVVMLLLGALVGSIKDIVIWLSSL